MSDDPGQGAKGQGTGVRVVLLCAAALKGPRMKKPNSGRARPRPFQIVSWQVLRRSVASSGA